MTTVDGLLSELDEYAVEQALQIADDADDAEITVLTVGPEDAKDALRKALSMGADKAVHVEDDDLHGTDALGTSLVLAKAIEKAGYDLVVSGMASTDGTWACCRRCWPSASASRRSRCCPRSPSTDGKVNGRRDGDTATEQLEASLPARRVGDRPVGRGPLPVVQGHHGREEEAGGVPGPVGPGHRGGRGRPRGRLDQGRGRHRSARARTAGTIVKDEGEGGKQLAEFLAGQKFI